MKTAISIPDEAFELVTATAQSIGMSRSEFFTRAALDYVERVADAALVAEIDRAVALAGSDRPDDAEGADDSSRAAVGAGRRRLVRDETSSDW